MPRLASPPPLLRLLPLLLPLAAALSTRDSHPPARPAVPRSLLLLRGGAASQPIASVKSPKEAYEGFAKKGAANAKLPLLNVLHQSVMGGCYVGLGGLLSMTIAGSVPGIASSNPGLQKFIFAALFPVNLLLILMTGGQLFTGNSAAVPAAMYEGLVTFPELVRSWVVSYVGNIIGCGALALAATYCGLNSYGTAELAVATAAKKCASSFGPTLVKAILCNWLVCLAVFLAGASDDLAGKMVGIWFPISTFVAIGLEHSVANLFLLPMGLLAGAKLSLADVIFKNLIPVTIGNAIAGAFVVAAGYSYAFGALGKVADDAVPIAVSSAREAPPDEGHLPSPVITPPSGHEVGVETQQDPMSAHVDTAPEGSPDAPTV
ncbi:hypothetical protein AB1Y20_003536 [Prymnesium parvum]|uniref:Formate/nitrite transporter n=1 Tax=Prymnesium parvum TaxID=97485 RepID=A0AB34J533_PRYPA